MSWKDKIPNGRPTIVEFNQRRAFLLSQGWTVEQVDASMGERPNNRKRYEIVHTWNEWLTLQDRGVDVVMAYTPMSVMEIAYADDSIAPLVLGDRIKLCEDNMWNRAIKPLINKFR